MSRWEDTVLDGRRARPRPWPRRSRSWPISCKGYGEVRRRLSGALERFLDEMLRPAIEADRRAGTGFARSTEVVRAGRQRLLADENASSLSPQGRA